MRQRSLLILLAIFFILLVTKTVYSQEIINEYGDNKIVKAKVMEIKTKDMENPADSTITETVTVRILDKRVKEKIIEVPNVIVEEGGFGNIKLRPGDEVLLYAEIEAGKIKRAYISDFVREKKLLYFSLAFLFLLVLIGGIKGVKSVISLAITGVAIFFVLLPLIFRGINPILITVIISALIATITFVIIGGLSLKTATALIGTVSGVVVAGIIAFWAGTSTQIVGLDVEEVNMLLNLPQQINIDLRGILFAGMIIGALGAVMDVGMSIASAVEEIYKTNPDISRSELVQAGMNIGRDIMGTMTNTLILAYTGSAIPLMLIFMAYDSPFVKLINLDMIATEIVRALAGSIGLVLQVPITAWVAGVLFTKYKKAAK